MNKRPFLILILAAVFAFQTFDFLPASPKTCCGRTVCMCRHAPGAKCPMKHHQENLKQTRPAHAGWTKAPCDSESPKSVLSHTAKEYFLPQIQNDFAPRAGEQIVSSRFEAVPLLRSQNIDHPPRFF